ncbi:MAG: bifunctional phosphoribosyl-AMP cyclohydrolase/phosphoribosyl-ATP diphosphatase HisIE [Steroidobacteraceae bacterium]
MNSTSVLQSEDVDRLAWDKGDGLLPAIVQDANNRAVLMLGYVNREALQETLRRGRVVFFSRSRQQLWEKGETSGHTLNVRSLQVDCDLDTVLIEAVPVGPTCHRNTPTCFGDGSLPAGAGIEFLTELQGVIATRIAERPEGSYTARLLAEGPRRMAQKVGEEGVEVALAASAGDDAELVSESADLVFHLMLLLQARGLSLEDVARELAARHRPKN